MSSASLKKFLTKLDLEMRQEAREYRKLVGNRKTTALIYDSKKIREALDILMQSNVGSDKKSQPISLDEDAKRKYDNLVTKLTRNIRKQFQKEVKLLPEQTAVYREIRGGAVFMLSEFDDRDNYTAIRQTYEGILNQFYKDFLVIINRKEGINRLSSDQKTIRTVDRAGLAFNLGHEEGSNIEHQVNDAVYNALQEVYGSSDNIPKSLENELKKFLGSDGEVILTVAKDGRRKTITVGISSALRNVQQGGKEEKNISLALGRALQKLGTPELEGSDSLTDISRKEIVKEIVDPFKKRKIRVTHEDITLRNDVNEEKVTKKVKSKKGPANLTGLTKKQSPRRRRTRRKPAPKFNLNMLLGIINNQLPRTVADNMGPPRLENRTGRFAQSVRATDIVRTPKGFPSIGYTYQRNPYGVFESTSGASRASIERDPRPLIDQSIRQIVIGLGIGRIFTRRQ